ncbi:hypothetical protein C8J56DRAFT_952828 [Mycena floridula]|nr:hypothetical protein C8J56DRAFT_952828 [Mycena floridula]
MNMIAALDSLTATMATFLTKLGHIALWSRLSTTFIMTITLSSLITVVAAQAPLNDVVSWPPGLLLLASVIYAALVTEADRLWEIEPSFGIFLWSGLPLISLPEVPRVLWKSSACHFVPGIRSAFGWLNIWVRADEITVHARSVALQKVLSVMNCVITEDDPSINSALWRVSPLGLVKPEPVSLISLSSPIKPPAGRPSARDFILFAAIQYHIFHEHHIDIYRAKKVIFSTKNMPSHSIVDVATEEEALAVVAAQMVRRPHSQSPLRAAAQRVTDQHFTLNLDQIDNRIAACHIDFHSYAPEFAKVTATLEELAAAYYHVVQYLNRTLQPIQQGRYVIASVGQSIWIGILGGALLDTGRITIKNVGGVGGWGMTNSMSADDAYLVRIEAILQNIAPYTTQKGFNEIVFSGGVNRRSTYPFLIAGLFGQAVICYFLAVGTSAGVWTSVAFANTLFNGRLTDWHSIYSSKTSNRNNQEPGLKMFLPGTQDLMVIATLNRSAPHSGSLRAGLFLNLIGLAAAVFGSVFQTQTRNSLGFGVFSATPAWVVYTSVAMCVGTSLLITVQIIRQQMDEKTWFDIAELETRWMIYSTLPCSVLISGLAIWFQVSHLKRYWPILDAITWMSGMPIGMLQHGRMVSGDINTLHMILLNRWIMGVVASAVGSS